MTLDSSNETVAILYDIENAPFEMLDYTLGKARKFQPCRTIVVSDWEAHPDQKRWERLLRRPGFTFRQINRTFLGKNSLDSALYDSAKLLYEEGVRKFFIITTDSDFVKIAELLNSGEPKSYIIGVGTKQASETLRNAYDQFLCYPQESKAKKDDKKKIAEGKEAKAETDKKVEEKAEPSKRKKAKTLKKGDVALKGAQSKATMEKAKEKLPVQEMKSEPKETVPQKQKGEGLFEVQLPKTLREELKARMKEEGVTMNELLTYLIMRGLAR